METLKPLRGSAAAVSGVKWPTSVILPSAYITSTAAAILFTSYILGYFIAIASRFFSALGILLYAIGMVGLLICIVFLVIHVVLLIYHLCKRSRDSKQHFIAILVLALVLGAYFGLFSQGYYLTA
ncbi:MAG: hypothetical protein AAF699_17295 [Pseudomonadota bacterium]